MSRAQSARRPSRLLRPAVLIVLPVLLLVPMLAWADPAPINNAVLPCDNSEHSGKPPCRSDSDSITVPAPTRDERKGVIVPPEIPAEGLPNRAEQPGADVVQPKVKPH